MKFKCANCGAPCDGAINGRGFCNEKACIDAVLGAVTRIIGTAMEALRPRPKREGPPVDCGDYLK